jgi:hypothetical protein
MIGPAIKPMTKYVNLGLADSHFEAAVDVVAMMLSCLLLLLRADRGNYGDRGFSAWAFSGPVIVRPRILTWPFSSPNTIKKKPGAGIELPPVGQKRQFSAISGFTVVYFPCRNISRPDPSTAA